MGPGESGFKRYGVSAEEEEEVLETDGSEGCPTM